uniref:Uncharacterized protein n=1 Tax=Sphaerodactylus townsendi TaxID=933632 RepID=A0ACB8EP67_9SAUR
MVRVVSVLGLVMLSVALLILSFISYVSLKKDNIFAPKYANSGVPRMYMFHAGFRISRQKQEKPDPCAKLRWKIGKGGRGSTQPSPAS